MKKLLLGVLLISFSSEVFAIGEKETVTVTCKKRRYTKANGKVTCPRATEDRCVFSFTLNEDGTFTNLNISDPGQIGVSSDVENPFTTTDPNQFVEEVEMALDGSGLDEV